MKQVIRAFLFTSYTSLVVFILIPQRATCQDEIFNGVKRKFGFQCGYGDQDWKLAGLDLSINVAYTYEVYFFQYQSYHSLLIRRKWGIDFLFQPQFNIVRFRAENDLPDKENAFEFGLNGGFLIRRNFNHDKLSLYFLISSGPHYISDAPHRQANGFIFSDNVNLGINYKIHEKIYLDFRPGFRHISNAGIQEPNSGLNTLTFSAGILITT